MPSTASASHGLGPASKTGDADAFWVDFGFGVVDGIPEVLTWSDGAVRYDLTSVGLDMPAM